VRIFSSLNFLLPFSLGGKEESVPGLVVRVGYRPTGSSKEEKGTTLGTEKTQGKLKDNQKQKYQPKDQNFKLTKNNKHHPKGRGLSCSVAG
jgi:hypothetical protein